MRMPLRCTLQRLPGSCRQRQGLDPKEVPDLLRLLGTDEFSRFVKKGASLRIGPVLGLEFGAYLAEHPGFILHEGLEPPAIHQRALPYALDQPTHDRLQRVLSDLHLAIRYPGCIAQRSVRVSTSSEAMPRKPGSAASASPPGPAPTMMTAVSVGMLPSR
ncbi:MAG: hypothetical protein Q8N17_18460 [Burkholderiaceae bacterium]|nr:hypothetical protein [Burkholderiaceae bacterium]